MYMSGQIIHDLEENVPVTAPKGPGSFSHGPFPKRHTAYVYVDQLSEKVRFCCLGDLNEITKLLNEGKIKPFQMETDMV